jgi:hypothetical protein
LGSRFFTGTNSGPGAAAVRDHLADTIERLASEERDAVLSGDWAAAARLAVEKAALKEVQQRALVGRKR